MRSRSQKEDRRKVLINGSDDAPRKQTSACMGTEHVEACGIRKGEPLALAPPRCKSLLKSGLVLIGRMLTFVERRPQRKKSFPYIGGESRWPHHSPALDDDVAVPLLQDVIAVVLKPVGRDDLLRLVQRQRPG